MRRETRVARVDSARFNQWIVACAAEDAVSGAIRVLIGYVDPWGGLCGKIWNNGRWCARIGAVSGAAREAHLRWEEDVLVGGANRGPSSDVPSPGHCHTLPRSERPVLQWSIGVRSPPSCHMNVWVLRYLILSNFAHSSARSPQLASSLFPRSTKAGESSSANLAAPRIFIPRVKNQRDSVVFPRRRNSKSDV